MPGEDAEPAVKLALCPCREAALGVVGATPDPTLDFLDLCAQITKPGESVGLEQRQIERDDRQGEHAAGMLVASGGYGISG